jgi:hypothetical protein
MSYTEYYNYKNRDYYKLGSGCIHDTLAMTSNKKFLPPLANIYTQNFQKISNQEYRDVADNESRVDEKIINKYLNNRVYYRNILSDIMDDKLQKISNAQNLKNYNSNYTENIEDDYESKCTSCGGV